MTRYSIFALVAAVTLLLVGCGVPAASTGAGAPGSTSDSADAEPDGDSLAAQLTGRSFETTSAADVTGFDLADDSALTLSFYLDHEDRLAVGGDAGCNSMGGVAVWDGDTVRADDLAQTEMACDGLMEQEAWWSGLLTSGLDLALNGDVLTARGAGEAGPIQITLRDSAVLHPDLPLVGSTWRLNGLLEGSGDNGVAMSAPNGIAASMTISEDPAGRLRLDVFNGLTWMSVPGGLDAATGEYSGEVVIEPADGADPLAATGGIVRVTGGLTGDSVGCPDGTTDCFVDMSLLGADFEFRTNRDTLTVTGLANYAGHGLTFIADDTAPAPDIPAEEPPAEGSPTPPAAEPHDNPLMGRTFELTGTWTDAGGLDLKDPSAILRLTFRADSATAEGSCGEFTYPTIQYGTRWDGLSVDLGLPYLAGCVIGDDPSMPPQGELMVFFDGDTMNLSNGTVAWHFRSAD